MYWIRLFFKTLKAEKSIVGFYLLQTGILILFFNLLLDAVVIAYPLLIGLVLLLVYLTLKTVGFHQLRSHLHAARIAGVLPRYIENAKDALVFSTISDIHSGYQDKLSTFREQLAGRNTMFTSFIHNMKSSAAVIELAASAAHADKLADIALENEKLKSNLEQALTMLRLDAFANDYVPESVELRALVSSVINERRRDFIYAEVYPKLSDSQVDVYTDKKWCAYMLDQLISNAIKYSPKNGKVYFDFKVNGEMAELQIRDEGIGIPPEDVPRVFELFYTGQNGRASGNQATGIGLAMVRQIAKQLGHEVSLSSVDGAGTCVTIAFRTKM